MFKAFRIRKKLFQTCPFHVFNVFSFLLYSWSKIKATFSIVEGTQLYFVHHLTRWVYESDLANSKKQAILAHLMKSFPIINWGYF